MEALLEDASLVPLKLIKGLKNCWASLVAVTLSGL